MAELDIIELIRKRAGRNSGAVKLGIGDDCAILQPPSGHELLVTTDFSLEGRHFTRDRHSPESIGHRTLARGLSDLAAMGASPLAVFLSLALPFSIARKKTWLPHFLDGLMALATEYKIPLAGGDTSESPDDRILADIVVLGSAPASKALRRSTARPGDAIYVTGTLGGAASELVKVLAAKRPLPRAGRQPHLFPEPRIAAGLSLRGRATACMDLSDGLSTDLTHLCGASGVRAEIDLASLPLADGATLEQALHGGEDYELLFTAAPSTRIPSRLGGVAITRIGTLCKQTARTATIVQIDRSGKRTPMNAKGWEHLR